MSVRYKCVIILSDNQRKVWRRRFTSSGDS